jgi:hypothetical protein
MFYFSIQILFETFFAAINMQRIMYGIHAQVHVGRHVMRILILSEWNKNYVSIHFNTEFNENALSHSVVVAFGQADGRTDRET